MPISIYPLKVQACPPRDQILALRSRVSGRYQLVGGGGGRLNYLHAHIHIPYTFILKVQACPPRDQILALRSRVSRQISVSRRRGGRLNYLHAHIHIYPLKVQACPPRDQILALRSNQGRYQAELFACPYPYIH